MIMQIIFLIFYLHISNTIGKNNNEENRPYEFGFNIEGEQHRHEKKDANGIIMGEFGFITADGIYHVTVYATDENGNFKILSMKNIPSKSQMQNHSTSSSQNGPIKQNQSPNMQPSQPSRSCSSCSIPSTATNSLAKINQGDRTLGSNQQNHPFNAGVKPEHMKNVQNPPHSSNIFATNERKAEKDETPQSANTFKPQIPDSSKNFIKKPVLTSAQMKIVSKDTDVNKLNPGEQKGLPQGLTENDMSRVLYTFNYTVGFHGHHEEGYTNGAKKGYYFVTGRNGVKTRIDYVADENGFRPTITEEVLDLLSDDVPKPETEKDEKYGLKQYEFKWFYPGQPNN